MTNPSKINLPTTIPEVSAAYWGAKGKEATPVKADAEDVSDLVPTPISHAGAFKAFHGRFAGRK